MCIRDRLDSLSNSESARARDCNEEGDVEEKKKKNGKIVMIIVMGNFWSDITFRLMDVTR